MATDIGFLQLDHEQQCLLVKGGQERTRIPVAAIAKTGLRGFAWGQEASTQFWLTGMTIRTPTSLRELPIGPRTAESQMWPRHRRALVEKLLATGGRAGFLATTRRCRMAIKYLIGKSHTCPILAIEMQKAI